MKRAALLWRNLYAAREMAEEGLQPVRLRIPENLLWRIVVLSLFCGAHMSEIIRGGVDSIV